LQGCFGCREEHRWSLAPACEKSIGDAAGEGGRFEPAVNAAACAPARAMCKVIVANARKTDFFFRF
jgi:hypothetical protein